MHRNLKNAAVFAEKHEQNEMRQVERDMDCNKMKK